MLLKYKYVCIGIIVIFLVWTHAFAFMLGKDLEKAEQHKKDIVVANQKVDAVKEQNIINNQIDASHIAEKKVLETRIKTIVKKVPVYVTKEDDSRCIIGNDIISLHNDAASL